MDLREEWNDLLHRRASLRPSLAAYGEVITRWTQTTPRVTPIALDAPACRATWERQRPLIAETPPDLAVDDVEPWLEIGVDFLTRTGESPDALQRFAERWDEGSIAPDDLYPRKGRIGAASLSDDAGLRPVAVEMLALVTLRPLLDAYFAPVRAHLTDGAWALGICPFCGGPPGFADVVEDGGRRLSCHLCGGAWRFSRVRCPFCGTEESKDLVRLELGEHEAGYFVAACKACSAYVKELDRRMRWNGGLALIEDWGSPHFDVAAQRERYWRPGGSLVQLVR